MSAWKPIESAPRDDPILLCNQHGTWIGRYVERFASGFRPENPWHTLMLNHRHMKRYASAEPTHWMPLPNPPSLPGEKET